MGRIPVRWPAPVDTAGAPPASEPVKGAAIEPVSPVAATVPAQGGQEHESGRQSRATLNLQVSKVSTPSSRVEFVPVALAKFGCLGGGARSGFAPNCSCIKCPSGDSGTPAPPAPPPPAP
eukprot:COSAG04_NODE_636_length_11710_cov_63.646973_2_plen_120_part_00